MCNNDLKKSIMFSPLCRAQTTKHFWGHCWSEIDPIIHSAAAESCLMGPVAEDVLSPKPLANKIEPLGGKKNPKQPDLTKRFMRVALEEEKHGVWRSPEADLNLRHDAELLLLDTAGFTPGVDTLDWERGRVRSNPCSLVLLWNIAKKTLSKCSQRAQTPSRSKKRRLFLAVLIITGFLLVHSGGCWVFQKREARCRPTSCKKRSV